MAKKPSYEELEKRVRDLEAKLMETNQNSTKLPDFVRDYQEFLTKIPTMLHLVDRNFRVTGVSDVWLKKMGYTRKEVIGRDASDFTTAESKIYAEKYGQDQFLNEGFAENIPYQLIKKDGSVIDVLVSAISIQDSDGTFLRGLGVTTDITDLKHSEKKFRDIFDNSGDSICVYDEEGVILEVNEVACLQTGYSRDELIRQKPFGLLADKEARSLLNRIQEVSKNGQAVYEIDIRRKDGSKFPVEINARKIEFEGEPAILAVARDITRRQQAEEEQARLRQQIQQSQKLESIGRLAGGVAHDLNNFLSPILGYGEMLLAYGNEDENRQKQLGHIIEAGKRARALVRQLLAFSRQQMLEFKTFDLNEIIKNFENLLRHTIREDIVINLNLSDSLPPIKADAGQIEQILMNLAVNAQDAMPYGGELSIETRAIELDEYYADRRNGVTPGIYVMLMVSDTGEGMDAATLSNIFEPFFTTKAKDKGTGLGLATAYGIVKQHGGNIWAYSEIGLGTTIKVYLPVCREEDIQEEAAPEMKTESDTNEPLTVLVAEDEKVVRELIVSMLELQGYSVLVGKSGKKALSAINCHDGPLDLLLTDVIMPDMSGKDLHNRLSQNFPGLKTIYMSGYTENVIAYHGVLDPQVNFLQKPFSVKDLEAKIREVMNQ